MAMTKEEQEKAVKDLSRLRSDLTDARKQNKADQEMGLLYAAVGGAMLPTVRAMLAKWFNAGDDQTKDRNAAVALWLINDQYGKDAQTRTILQGMAGALAAGWVERGGLDKLGAGAAGPFVPKVVGNGT